MTLTKAALIARIGEQRYREESTLQREFAEQADYSHAIPPHFDELDDDSYLNIPQEIGDFIWDADAHTHTKLDVLFEIYDEMPAYGLLYVLALNYGTLSSEDRRAMWSRVRERLASNERALVQPLQYALLVNFFENPQTVAEAWDALTDPHVAPAVLEAALLASAPAPFSLKEAVYNRLVNDPGWHPAIFQSLRSSVTEAVGQVEAKSALRLLERLDLPSMADEKYELQQRLQELIE